MVPTESDGRRDGPKKKVRCDHLCNCAQRCDLKDLRKLYPMRGCSQWTYEELTITKILKCSI